MTVDGARHNIWIGPGEPPAALVAAVVHAGGRVTSAEQASAIVWFGGSPSDMRSYLHSGIRWVQLPGAGIEGFIAAGVVTTDRLYTSAAGSYGLSVAEHALALMLAGSHRLHHLARARTWTDPAPTSLRHSCVVIVGCGGIGLALIELLRPFETDVVAITRSGRAVPGASVSTTPDELHKALANADFVVVAAPSTAETSAMIGTPELATMPPTAWLINVARGALVDTDALVQALRSGQIGGAALDVTDPEPLPDDHPLWDEPNALITPHSANPASLHLPQLAVRVEDNVRRYINGEQLVGMVDLDAGY